jgi:hypothetical protein
MKITEASTVGQCGWKGKENGELLETAEAEFDIFLTTDQGIPHEQNLSQIKLGIVILGHGAIGLRIWCL